LNSYGYNAQAFPIQWAPINRYPASIQDGTSTSIFFTEKECGPKIQENDFWPDWGKSIADDQNTPPWNFTGPAAMFLVQPTQAQIQASQNQNLNVGTNSGCCGMVAMSPHAGGIQCGMGDGSVRFVGVTVSPNTWWAALTVDGGEVLGNDW
jgi:hypothetical protein